MTWIKYEPGDPSAYIPPERWGRDHWSTLMFVESRAVNHGGVLDNRRMRTNARLHRQFAANMSIAGNAVYPTRLKGGEEKTGHDDWSCLEDMAAFGFVELEFTRVVHTEAFNNSKARVTITPKGMVLASMLRRYKQSGGKLADFEYRWTEDQDLMSRFWRVYLSADPPPLDETIPFKNI